MIAHLGGRLITFSDQFKPGTEAPFAFRLARSNKCERSIKEESSGSQKGTSVLSCSASGVVSKNRGDST